MAAVSQSQAPRTRPARLSAVDMINLAVEANDSPMSMGAIMIVDGEPLRDDAGHLRLATIRAEIDRRLACRGGSP